METLNEQIQSVKDIIEDGEFAIIRSKSPKAKRIAIRTVDFFKSVLNSLQELDTIKSAK